MKSVGEIGYEAAMTFKRGFGDAFADAMMRARSLEEAMNSLAASIQRAVLASIGENIAAGIMGSVVGGGGFFGGGGGTSWTQTGSGKMGVASGFGGGFSMAQEGGVFTRPTAVIAGEVPEAFVPLSGGRSIPVEMRGGGEQQSGNRTINVNIVAMDSQDVFRVLSKNKRMLANMLFANMQNNPALRRFEK
jgi:hypothetical protein